MSLRMHAGPPAGDTASIISTNTTSTAPGRSIYPRGPGFTLDTFSSKDFIVKDFVETLSDGATASRRSGAHTQSFDPKPYIRTFEHALTRLDALSEDREGHENELSGAVRRAEQRHREHCSTLQRKLDQALDNFNSLEGRMDSGNEFVTVNGSSSFADASVALQIGERLEELDRQKTRAEDAKTLITCWQDATERGDLTYLEDLRRMGGGEGKVKCARIARQMLKISAALSANRDGQPNGANLANGDYDGVHRKSSKKRSMKIKQANEIVEKFLERLEKDLLEQFESSKRMRNENGMRECATALYDFREGASVIARYVNQHDFFLERSAMISEEVTGDPDVWNRLADPDAEPPGIESSLQSLVDEVKLVLEEESFIIKQVFPFYEQVLMTFISRVFQQSVQQRLELVLAKANDVSSIAFLRSLQAARVYIGGMVDDLKAHGLTEHPDPVSSQVSSSLDAQLEALFVPYFGMSSYIDREKRSLEELYGSLLFKFTLFQAKRRTAPNSFLGAAYQRGRQLLSSARDSWIERLESTELPASQKAMLLRIAGLRSSNKQEAEEQVSEEDGTLSIPIAKRMLKWMAESVGRDLELSGGAETPKDVSALLKLLISQMIDIYVDSALDTANDAAVSQENAKNEPDMSFIFDVQVAIQILQLLITVSQSVLIPLAASNVTVRREMEKTLNTTISRMEDKIAMIRTRTIDAALAWVTKLLNRQNRADFRPKDDAIGIEQLQTPTCSSIFAFLSKVRDLSLRGVEGRNAEVFFTDLAVGFRSLLLDHLKKFPVNLAGGLMVSKDITKYIELLRSFPLAASFQPSLEILVEVGNIFVIGPEALKDRLRGGSALTGIDRADLRPYILRREDAGSVGVQSALNAL
ncbi:MAG: hypothetical protein Q9162_003817 [Coniocarpon cinnabarinum]